ncbi:MAG TPA: RNA 2',3'-cyclic phosphodiesterase [Candidatus Magasanikbacteria bacterium]|nr:RNA 2',3'-cyclic phosphodiesterase [Candidatus Magasanikbacteria bacterium]
MTRTFIALPLPLDIGETVVAFQSNLMRYNAHGGIVWVAPDALHVTVQFLGSQSDEALTVIKNSIETACTEHTPFPLQLNHPDAFPSLDRQRIIIVKCHNEGKVLFRLREKMLGALKHNHVTFEEERNVWVPHITIARNRVPGYFFRRLTELTLEQRMWDVHEIVLYKSELTPQGPHYSVLHTVSL